MKTAYIFLNGNFDTEKFLKSNWYKPDFVIAADGGIRHLKDLNIKIDMHIGDFDSSVKNENTNISEFPKEKDQSDGEIAIKMVKDFNRIIIIGAFGGRFDHEILIVLNALKRKSEVYLTDGKQNAKVLQEGDNIFNFNKKTIFSLIAFSDSKISIKGAKWDLEQTTLKPYSSLCLSNETLENNNNSIVINLEEGKSLLYWLS